jgi:hypothetical protein
VFPVTVSVTLSGHDLQPLLSSAFSPADLVRRGAAAVAGEVIAQCLIGIGGAAGTLAVHDPIE